MPARQQGHDGVADDLVLAHYELSQLRFHPAAAIPNASGDIDAPVKALSTLLAGAGRAGAGRRLGCGSAETVYGAVLGVWSGVPLGPGCEVADSVGKPP